MEFFYHVPTTIVGHFSYLLVVNAKLKKIRQFSYKIFFEIIFNTFFYELAILSSTGYRCYFKIQIKLIVVSYYKKKSIITNFIKK